MVGTLILAVVSSSSFQRFGAPLPCPAGAGRDEAPLWPWSVEHLCTAAPCCPGGKICPGHLGLLLAPRDALQPSPRPPQLPPLPWPLLSDCLALPMVPMVHCRLLCPRCR